MTQACGPLIRTTSINFTEDPCTSKSSSPFGRKDDVTGQGLRVQFLSLIQTSPIVICQVSQGRDPGHIEIDDKTLIDKKIVFHLSLNYIVALALPPEVVLLHSFSIIAVWTKF